MLRGQTGLLSLTCAAMLFFNAECAVAALADTVEEVRPSVVAVGTAYPARQPLQGRRSNEIRGTGFAIGDGRLVATNEHVIPKQLDLKNRQTLAVFAGRGSGAKVYPATVVVRDTSHDLALLKIDGPAIAPLALAGSPELREGDEVAFTGFPIGAVLGLYPATQRGIVSVITPMAAVVGNSGELAAAQLARMREPFDVYQLDAIAYPGNSGSPVYRSDSAEVIAVINSVFVKESREAILQRPSGISYAIPVSHLRRLLQRYLAED